MKNGTCYPTHDAKRRLFPRKMVPQILASASRQAREEENTLGAWLASHGVLEKRDPLEILEALHNAARAGRYVETLPAHCDRVQSAKKTLSDGGDCDQWAAVIMACCAMLEIPASLVGFGFSSDPDDPFEHVAVVCEIGDAAVILDPKGSQKGAAFNVWPEMEITGGWAA